MEIVDENGDLEAGNNVGDSIVGGISGLFGETDDGDILDGGYELLGDLQSSLLWFVFYLLSFLFFF